MGDRHIELDSASLIPPTKGAMRKSKGIRDCNGNGNQEQCCPWPVCSPRSWPLEVPTPRGEFSDSTNLGFPPLARFFHPERLAFGDDEHVVVQQSVEQADRRRAVGQEPPPVLEGPVRGNPERAAFIDGSDETE